MPTDAILTYGMRLFSSPDGTTYTEYADMKEIGTVPTPEAPEVDVTPLADSDNARQFRLGLIVPGEFEAKQFFSKTRLTRVISEMRVNRYWRIVWPDGASVSTSSKIEFRGWLKSYTPPATANPDDPAVISFKVKVTGAITFTEAS